MRFMTVIFALFPDPNLKLENQESEQAFFV